MATKRGKRTTKRVKTLRSKSLSTGKAKGVRGGSLGAGTKKGPTQNVSAPKNFYGS